MRVSARHASLAPVLLALAIGCGESTGPRVEPAACDDAAGVICTWAGTGSAGFDGDGHSLLESSFYWPVDVTVAGDGRIYVVDWNNHRVRRVTPAGTFETVIGNDMVGDGPTDQSDLFPPGAPGSQVTLNHPTHLVPLRDGKLLLTAWHNHKLRTYDPATGLVEIVCGSTAGFSGDGGLSGVARLNQPSQTQVGADGGLYVLDQRNQRVRRIAPDGTIATVVGTGVPGFAGDDGPPLAAQLHMPYGSNPPTGGGLAFDAEGRLYISDTLNHRIRRVDFVADRIETVAGNGVEGYSGDGGPATAASLAGPRDLVFGPDGRLYVADEHNNRVRVVDLTDGTIDTFVGDGVPRFAGDGGPARSASLHRPVGLEWDAAGRLYIADSYNHRIRRLKP